MAKNGADEIKIRELLIRSVEKIFPSEDYLEQRLRSKERLSVYLGIDPTGPDLHLGHSVQLLVLKRFQRLGHRIIIVIGDFTAQIGDPTGKDLTRKPISQSEVRENARKYKDQISKILDIGRTNFEYNSHWLNRLNFKDVVRLGALKTVQQLLDRDMFQRRLAKGEAIGVHEFLYPLMQGYDSVALKVDGEIGGSDQTFNMLVGRDLEKHYLDKEKFVLTTRLLIDFKTGRKMMSKSEGNYISLQDEPREMYAKILSLSDETVFDLFELCTEVPFERIDHLKSSDILTAKHELAYEITKIYHGEKGADFGREEFNRVFRQKEIPRGIPEFKFKEEKMKAVDLLLKTNLADSTSEAKKLFQQGAVRIDDEIVSDWSKDILLKNNLVVRVGPRRFARIDKG